ncbi:MAG: TonB-dependent receptor [Pseudomonadota bacterium]
MIEGEKIDRSYVDTHASVGVVTGEQVDELNIDDLKDSFRYVGNVRFFEGNRGNNGFVIRGINSEGVTEPTNNAPVTSVIIDGATQSVESTRRGARGIWDIEQIEIFRGPQSTLQGRGALAGAVIVETRDPTFFYEAGAEFVGGQDKRRDAAFYLSGPIIQDQLAVRLSGEARQRDLDIDFNVPENEVLAEDRYRNLRGKLLFEPSFLPDLSVLLTASTTFDRPGVRAVNSEDFFDREFNSAPTTAVERREATNNNYIAEIGYAITDDLFLTSITSFIDSELEISTPAGLSFEREESRAGEDITQDLRLEIGSAGDAFSGVLGGFFGNFTLPRTSLVTVGNGLTVIQDLTSDNKTRNLSVYGDVRWEFVEDLSLLAGLRYTNETVENTATGTSFNAPIDVDASADFNVFLPKIGLAYKLTDNQSIAVTAQRGYRSGFTEVSGDLIRTVDPEFLWNYELAYRAESPQGRWFFGATAFFYDYSNQQIPITVFDGQIPITRTENAGSSRSFGAEFEGRYIFEQGLDVFGSLGLLQTEFRSLDTAAGDFEGNEFPEAPAVTASLGATYQHDTGLFVSGDVVYTDSFFSSGSISNDPALKVDNSVELGLRAGFEHEFWKLTVYAENLLDAEIITSLNNNGVFGAEPVEATIADGLRIGVEFRVEF